MTDVNDRSFSASTAAGNVSPRTPKWLRSPSTSAIWRFRPALPPVSVVRTIKTQIIPKIVLALRNSTAPGLPQSAEEKSADSVAQFAVLALARDDDAARAYVDGLLAQGTSVESVFVDLLAPTARHFGTQWEADATDFASVTLGVGRLHQIMRLLAEHFVNEGNGSVGHEGSDDKSILLATIPGEQHSFGLSMVAEFFRRAGWNLCIGPFTSHRELTSLVHAHWFDIVGFSVSGDRRLDELKQDIQDIRRVSRNRDVGIMLGGPMMITHPDLVALMGADMMSVDATIAPQQALGLIRQMRGHD